MSKPSKDLLCAYAIAGEVFEAQRGRGETVADAMRAACAVLRSHNRANVAPKVARSLPQWARELIASIAQDHGLTVEKLRGPGAHARRVRGEAVYLVRVVGHGEPTYKDLGAFLERDHSTLVYGEQCFEMRLATEEVTKARIETWLRERGFVRTEEAA